MDPVGVIERLVETDIPNATAADLPGLFHQLRQITGWASTIEGQLARRANELESAGSGVDAATAIARGKKASQHEARRTARRAEALGMAPDLEHQLAKGRVSTEHADVLGNAAAKLTEMADRDALFAQQAELAEHAAAETPAQFARTVARTIRRSPAMTSSTGLSVSAPLRTCGSG